MSHWYAVKTKRWSFCYARVKFYQLIEWRQAGRKNETATATAFQLKSCVSVRQFVLVFMCVHKLDLCQMSVIIIKYICRVHYGFGLKLKLNFFRFCQCELQAYLSKLGLGTMLLTIVNIDTSLLTIH